jgi:tetratricopeptide (TPR) repeat protein
MAAASASLDSLKSEAASLMAEAGWPEPGRALSDLLRYRPLTWVTMRRALPSERTRRCRAARALADRLVRLAPRDAECWIMKGAAHFYLTGDLDLGRAPRLAARTPLVDLWMAYSALQRLSPADARRCADRALAGRVSSWGLCLRAEAAIAAGDREAGRLDLDESLRLDPSRVWAYVLRSELLRDMKRYDEALADLDALVEVHPQAWSYAVRARTGFNFRDQQKALRDLERAVALDPELREGYAYRGEAYRRLGRPLEALKEFDRCLSGLPRRNTERVRSWRGAALLTLGRRREAVAELTPVIRAQSEANISWALAQRAQARLGLGQYGLAVADMNRAARIDPKSGWIYGSPGGAKGTLDRYEEITRLFTRALAARPRWAWGYGWRGETHLRTNHCAEALIDLSRAVRLSPRQARFWAWRGLAKQGLGDVDGARTDFERAARLAPRYASAHSCLADLFMRQGRFLEAKACLDRYLKLETRTAWAYAWRGECLVKCGKHAEAKADLENAVNLHMLYGDAWSWLAEAKRNLGDLRGAREAVDRALSLEGKKDVALVVSGMIYADLGDPSAQLREFRRAAEHRPGLFDAAPKPQEAS